ncbi:MAG: tetratricopeptide repeat protein, partial [Vicinamibacterales bacterium]
AALAVVAVGGLSLYFRSGRSATTAERVSTIVAEFTNTTGDPVFTGSLRRAAVVSLRQSPFVSVIADAAIADTLQALGRAPNDTLTAPLARDVCTRASGSVLVDGDISLDAGTYTLVVGASQCMDGRVIARERQTFTRKDEVLPALGRAIDGVRQALGESPGSLLAYDVPIQVATTDSVEALRAFHLGMDLRVELDNTRAIPAFKTAIALDPQFALAYAQLGSSYSNMGRTAEAIPYLRKAFALRDRATEPERLYITGRYFDIVTGELEKGSETYRLWTRIYPDEWLPNNALANDADLLGRYDVAVSAAKRAVELDPKQLFGRVNLMTALVSQNRFEDAIAEAKAILAIDPNNASAHVALYAIALHAGDAADEQREVEWGARHAGEEGIPYVAAETAALHGRMREMRRLFHEVARRSRADGNDEGAGNALAFAAVLDSFVGFSEPASSEVAEALALGKNEIIIGSAAIVDARAGRAAAARGHLAVLDHDYPITTANLGMYTPMIRSALVNPATSSAADVTRDTSAGLPYEFGQTASLQPPYLRGLAYLAVRAPDLAIMEFQKVIDHVGVDPVTPFWSLSYLGVARADAALGRRDESRKAYETFFAVWKTADRDVPMLLDAQREYAALK